MTTAQLRAIVTRVITNTRERLLHWRLLDNFEWGHWEPTFGLVAVDRATFARTPKPSLGWLGGIARAGKES